MKLLFSLLQAVERSLAWKGAKAYIVLGLPSIGPCFDRTDA